MALYGWGSAPAVGAWSLACAIPFALAAAFSPAMLSLVSTGAVIAPVAEARALISGAATLSAAAAPFYAFLLFIAGEIAEAPGRIHLIAKALAAAFIALQAAVLFSSRMPSGVVALASVALCAYAAAPFAGPPEIGLALLLIGGAALLSPPVSASPARAVLEGALIGAGFAVLWLTSPAMPIAALPILALAPFHGRANLVRTIAAAVLFCLAASLLDLLAPGFNEARLALARHELLTAGSNWPGAAAFGGAAVSTAVVIVSAAIFGGREQWRSWASGLALGACGLGAALLAGANPAPVFFMASIVAAFSIASPFYSGVFRNHDRASVSLAIAAGALTLFWAGAQGLTAGGQLLFQFRAAEDAPGDIRAELGLVQPGGLTLAQWIAEGRFAAVEAREALIMTPADESAVLLEGAARAREMASRGVDVAILTGADTACVIAGRRPCRADGPRAASAAQIVFVPRLDLDRATAEAKKHAQAILYTDFRFAGQTELWDIWVRRNARCRRTSPRDLNLRADQIQ